MTLRSQIRMRPQQIQQRVDIGFRHARPRLRMKVTFVVCLALLALPPSLLADTHYVSKTGSNTYPYDSWSTATDSLSPAVEASDTGDTVRVGPGTFYEHSVWLKTATALVGAGMDSTTLVSTEPGAFVTPLLVMGDSSSVEGFYLLGNGLDRAVLFTDGNVGAMRRNRVRGFNSGVDAGLISFKHPNGVVQIENNTIELCIFPVTASSGFAIIRNNRVYPSYVSPAIFCGGANPIVEGNVIGGIPPALTDAERRSFYGNGASLVIHQSITVEFCSDFVVRNNVIWGGNTGVFIDNASQNDPLLSWGVVENNTCYDVAGAGVRVTRNNVLVRNNIIAHSGRLTPVVEADRDSVRFEYNLLWDYDNAPVWGPGNTPVGSVFADPMLVDSLDFHLQAFSPAIDAGDPALLDVDGSRSDIGAYGGPFGQSYAYPDLPPNPPLHISGSRSDTLVELTWNANSESDLLAYRVYRDTTASLIASPEVLVASVPAPDTGYADTAIVNTGDYFYGVVALDAQGNASALSEIISLAATGIRDSTKGILPSSFEVLPNYPNPFNASTVLRFSLGGTVGARSDVSITIHDALGRKIRTFALGHISTGPHSVFWDGRDDAGKGLPSGVYFIRVSTESGDRIGKALLLR